MATVTVSIKTQKDPLIYAASGQQLGNLKRLRSLLKGFISGALLGSIDIQTSSSDPVAAAATATLTYASVAAADTITILGVVLTCTAGTPAAGEWKKEVDVTTTAVNLAAAINANATLVKHVTATSALGVVTVTANLKGELGNYLVILAKSSSGIVLVQWTGGTGGPASAAVQIRG